MAAFMAQVGYSFYAALGKVHGSGARQEWERVKSEVDSGCWDKAGHPAWLTTCQDQELERNLERKLRLLYRISFEPCFDYSRILRQLRELYLEQRLRREKARGTMSAGEQTGARVHQQQVWPPPHVPHTAGGASIKQVSGTFDGRASRSHAEALELVAAMAGAGGRASPGSAAAGLSPDKELQAGNAASGSQDPPLLPAKQEQPAAVGAPLQPPVQVPKAPTCALPEPEREGEGMGEYVQHDAAGLSGSQQLVKAAKKPRVKTTPSLRECWRAGMPVTAGGPCEDQGRDEEEDCLAAPKRQRKASSSPGGHAGPSHAEARKLVFAMAGAEAQGSSAGGRTPPGPAAAGLNPGEELQAGNAACGSRGPPPPPAAQGVQEQRAAEGAPLLSPLHADVVVEGAPLELEDAGGGGEALGERAPPPASGAARPAGNSSSSSGRQRLRPRVVAGAGGPGAAAGGGVQALVEQQLRLEEQMRAVGAGWASTVHELQRQLRQSRRAEQEAKQQLELSRGAEQEAKQQLELSRGAAQEAKWQLEQRLAAAAAAGKEVRAQLVAAEQEAAALRAQLDERQAAQGQLQERVGELQVELEQQRGAAAAAEQQVQELLAGRDELQQLLQLERTAKEAAELAAAGLHTAAGEA